MHIYTSQGSFLWSFITIEPTQIPEENKCLLRILYSKVPNYLNPSKCTKKAPVQNFKLSCKKDTWIYHHTKPQDHWSYDFWEALLTTARVTERKKKNKKKKRNKNNKSSRRVWRYQRCNQNPYNEEWQITQWPTEKGQKDKQRSTKHYT